MRNSLLALAFSGLALAQDQPPVPPVQDQNAPQQPMPQQNGGWRKFGDPNSSSTSQPAPAQGGYQGGYSSTVPQAGQPPIGGPGQAPMQPMAAVPNSLTLPAGTYVTVRTTNPISTDRNQIGDAFTAVLTEPIVLNGFVVARRGQTIQGRVSESQKAGHVSGTSKLGLELTQITLVDGQQLPLHSQMVVRDGGTSYGRDAAAIGTTTAVGAAIGAGVNGGVGAGVGAAGGLVASTLGVLLTRGKPAVIYPETVLTFKVLDPITISTANSAGAFHPVGSQDYENNTRRLVSSPAPRPAYGYPGPYYASPYPYYYAPYYGPTFFFGGGRYYRRW